MCSLPLDVYKRQDPRRAKKQKKFEKKRCPAGLRGEKETVRPEKREKTGLGKKKELVRPAESEKTEEIREKEVPCGSERGKRDRETREVSEGGEKDVYKRQMQMSTADTRHM